MQTNIRCKKKRERDKRAVYVHYVPARMIWCRRRDREWRHHRLLVCHGTSPPCWCWIKEGKERGNNSVSSKKIGMHGLADRERGWNNASISFHPYVVGVHWYERIKEGREQSGHIMQHLYILSLLRRCWCNAAPLISRRSWMRSRKTRTVLYTVCRVEFEMWGTIRDVIIGEFCTISFAVRTHVRAVLAITHTHVLFCGHSKSHTYHVVSHVASQDSTDHRSTIIKSNSLIYSRDHCAMMGSRRNKGTTSPAGAGLYSSTRQQRKMRQGSTPLFCLI